MVGRLVLGKLQNLDQAQACHRVAKDETLGFQFLQQRLDLNRIEGEQFALDALRAVFHAAGAIGQGPQASEAQARPWRALGKVFVLEEAWFDVACTGHQAISKNSGASPLIRLRAISA
jgi:hypothetical protein